MDILDLRHIATQFRHYTENLGPRCAQHTRNPAMDKSGRYLQPGKTFVEDVYARHHIGIVLSTNSPQVLQVMWDDGYVQERSTQSVSAMTCEKVDAYTQDTLWNRLDSSTAVVVLQILAGGHGDQDLQEAEVIRGNYVPAIKELRSRTGWNLHDAKIIVEFLICNISEFGLVATVHMVAQKDVTYN